MNGKSWLNRTVLGIALASLFSDWSREMATAILPTFLGFLGATAAWLGIIEGVSDGLSTFAKLGSGFYPDGLSRRKPIAFVGYLVTTLSCEAKAWAICLFLFTPGAAFDSVIVEATKIGYQECLSVTPSAPW